jgi:hypothetical protein
MKKIILLAALLLPVLSKANNLQISNLAVSLPNVSFTIQWDNSWNTTNNINPLYPNNWDGVWVFIKYQNNIDNLWKHATLSATATDHSVSGGVLEINTVSDGMGVFVRRSAPGSGSISATTVTLKMNSLTGTGDFNFRAFGTEMVYMPSGAFQLGDGNVSGANYFTPVTVDAASQTSGIAAGALYSGSPAVPAAFPTGFNAAYLMKYELTNEQWVDFMNTLTYDQQVSRMDVAPNGAAGTLAYNSGPYVNYSMADNVMKIKTSGLNNTRPVVLGCDLNNNNVFGENGDGQNTAASVLNKGDILAYLDWSGLRPITEMEFEKACRGTMNRIQSEYAWGSTALNFRFRSGLSNKGLAEESYNGTVLDGQAMGGALNAGGENNTGPSRSGVFASGSSGRASSGAGFYGAMELSGNALELAVQVDSKGVLFTNKNGNGQLTASGDSDVQTWPLPTDNSNPSGMHWRGGEFYSSTSSYFMTSYRAYGVAGTSRNFVYGGRGIRTAP